MKEGGKVVSPYDHFFMQEAAARGNPEEIAMKILALEREHLIRPDAETSAKLEKLKN